jgi:hypothetical protein
MTTTTQQLSISYPKAAQHNLLVRHPMHMGLYEARIFALMLGCLKADMTTFPPVIRIAVKDVIGGAQPSGKIYPLIKKACKALFGRELSLLPVNSASTDVSLVRLVQDVEHIKGTGYIEATFGSKIAPYLLQLKTIGNFTIGEIEQLMRLRNANSHRVYWLLKSYLSENIRECSIGLEEFREIILGEKTDKYKEFKQFNRAILTPVMLDLAQVGFPVAVQPTYNGRFVTGLRFTEGAAPVKALKAPVAKAVAKAKPDIQLDFGLASPVGPLADWHQKLRTRLVEHLKISEAQFNLVVGVLKPTNEDMYKEYMTRLYPLYQTSKDKHSMGGVTNIPAWAMAEIKKVFYKEFNGHGGNKSD